MYNWTKIDTDNVIKFIDGGKVDSKLWLIIEPKLDRLIERLLNTYFIYNASEFDYILTDVKVDLYLKLEKFDNTRGNVFNFLTTLSLNILRNRFKKENRIKEKFVDQDITEILYGEN